MDIIVSVASIIAEYMVAPIGRQFGYILYYKGNLERLKTEIQKLEGTKDSVQHSVDEARSNGEEIEKMVQNWLNIVDNTAAEATKLIDTVGHANADQCCMGHIPNLRIRHNLSRKTKNMTQEISKILAEGKFDRISYRVASQVTITPFGRGQTSRDLNVLNCEMGTQKEFRLEVLFEEDGWKLFEKMAGDVVHEFNIKPIALEVAKCCAGLPLLIVTVAKALRKRDVSAWKDALNQLERFDQEGLHKKVYSTLELSYNCLESNELKSLFLFIGSFGLDHIHTGVLFSCYWGLGLCRHIQTLTEARNRFYNLINDLRASSLLLEREWDRVRMHDLVRDVAKSIASRFHPTYSVQRYSVIKEWPKVDQLIKCHHIILPWSYIHELPEKLECPELKLLLLHNIGDHLKVPDDFFSGITQVKVLDLYGMVFTPSPPPSLRLMTNLRSLSLAGCVLEDISMVVELKSLEILSLARSDIKELPEEIGQLDNLRILNLTNCSGLKFIPANLISSLTCLEELYMGNCFIQWNVKRSKDQTRNASLEELRNLSHLTTLDVRIQDASVLPRDLQVFAKLERYNIFIGDMWKWSLLWSGGASESSRILKLMESKSKSIRLDHGFKLSLNSVEDMCLAGLQCVGDVVTPLSQEALHFVTEPLMRKLKSFF